VSGVLVLLLSKRNRGTDQRRLQWSGSTDRDHDRITEGVQKRVGVKLPIVRQPDVTRRVNLTTCDSFQSVASVTGGR